MADKKFEFTKDQKFWRGLIFVSAGAYLLLRLAARDSNGFFTAAALVAIMVAICALALFIWSVVENND